MKQAKTDTDNDDKKKVCNWCKKYGFPCKGHLQYQCQRLKEEQSKKKKQKQKEKDQKEKDHQIRNEKADKDVKVDMKAELAHVSTEVV